MECDCVSFYDAPNVWWWSGQDVREHDAVSSWCVADIVKIDARSAVKESKTDAGLLQERR